MPVQVGAGMPELNGAQQLRRGRGTQPWVYEAGDRVLKIYGSLEEAEQRRLRAEASIGLALAELDGVVPTLAVYDEQEHLVVEMPKMGPSVADHLECTAIGNEPRLVSELYAEAITRVAWTVQEMHVRGLVHGHITPSNLLVDPQTGWLTVSDFSNTRSNAIPAEPGGSRHRSAAAAAARMADRYIAPEQYESEHGPSVDQYALGVVARELLTASGAPNLTTPVHDVLQRATAPRPADRFDSLGAFGTALEHAFVNEAPKRFADRLAALQPHHRAALVPAILATVASIAFTSADATVGPHATGVPLLNALAATPLLACFTWLGVVLAGALRRRTGWKTVAFRGRAPATVLASLAVVAAWVVAADDVNWVQAVWLTLVGVYGASALLMGTPADAGSGIVRVARRWDRRLALSRPRRFAVTTVAAAFALALATAPMIAAALWPGDWPDRPPSAFPPLASVWNFRALVGSREAERACDTVIELPPAPRRAHCVDLARIAGAIERSDPVTDQPSLVFGVGDSFNRFRVQEIPSPGATRSWRLRAHSGGHQVGFMYTAGAARDRVTVLLNRDVPAQGGALSRSIWSYELVQRPDAWKITGFRACTIPPPGSGAQPPKCQITDTTPADVVRQLLALARKKGNKL